MRVLFVVTPGVGHLFPMVPLAWALRAAGHEVLIATTGAGLVAANAGLAVTDVAPDAHVHVRMRDRVRQHAALAGRPPGQPGPAPGRPLRPR